MSSIYSTSRKSKIVFLEILSADSELLDENAVIYKRRRFQPERSKWSENATANMTLSARVTTVDPYAETPSEGGGNSGGGGVEEEP